MQASESQVDLKCDYQIELLSSIVKVTPGIAYLRGELAACLHSAWGFPRRDLGNLESLQYV